MEGRFSSMWYPHPLLRQDVRRYSYTDEEQYQGCWKGQYKESGCEGDKCKGGMIPINQKKMKNNIWPLDMMPCGCKGRKKQ